MDRDVFYRPKGVKEVSKFRMFAIDAAEAVAKWPEEYSYNPPAKSVSVLDKTDPSFLLTAAEDGKPLLPASIGPEEKPKELGLEPVKELQPPEQTAK